MIVLPLTFWGTDCLAAMQYKAKTLQRNEALPFSFWRLDVKDAVIDNGRYMLVFIVDFTLPIHEVVTVGGFLSGFAAVTISPWFLLGSLFFSLAAFFSSALWFYPVIKHGLRKSGVISKKLYVQPATALSAVLRTHTEPYGTN